VERVTDPWLIEQLEEAQPGEPVIDDSLIRQLEGVAPITPKTPQGESRPLGGALGIIPLAEDPDGSIRLSVPGMLLEPWRAFQRGLAREARRGQLDEEGNPIDIDAAQSKDALIASGIIAPGSIPSTPGRATVAKAAAPKVVDDPQVALQAAERLGVAVPRGATGDLLPRVAGAVVDAPIIGKPLVDAAKRSTAKLENTVDEIADALGGTTIQSSGDTAKDELIRWVKVGSKGEAAKIFEPVEKLVGSKKAPLSRTAIALKALTDEAAESGLPPPGIVKQLESATKKEGGLTWRGMQRLRTEIGDRLSGEIVPEPGLNKRALKAVYAALSVDIDFLVQKAGGKAGVEAWKAANATFTTEIAARRAAIAKIVGSTGDASAETVAERIITMASDKGGADLGRLREVHKTLSPSAWDQIASAALGRMGVTKDGWSIAHFRTAFSKLSDEGKRLLIRDPEHLQALEDVNTVGKAFEQLQRLGNPSGTARMGMTVAGAGALVMDPTTLLATAVGGRTLAYILARPATAKAAAGWSNAWLAALKNFTEENYRQLQRATLDFRAATEREGIQVMRPGMFLGEEESE
jgi:hypothetical protein